MIFFHDTIWQQSHIIKRMGAMESQQAASKVTSAISLMVRGRSTCAAVRRSKEPSWTTDLQQLTPRQGRLRREGHACPNRQLPWSAPSPLLAGRLKSPVHLLSTATIFLLSPSFARDLIDHEGADDPDSSHTAVGVCNYVQLIQAQLVQHL